MYYYNIPEDIKEQYRYAIQKSREDREKHLNWIKEKIDEVITLITSYDMIFVLGSLGVRFLKATPTSYNQFLANNSTAFSEITKEEMYKKMTK